MPIRIKVAVSAQELNDVYKLRHQVYVENEGYFKDMPGDVIVDQFDTMPRVANIIAYDEETKTPVGTMRINGDSEILLPSDEVFSFVEYREKINKQRKKQGLSPAIVGSAGMLAIAEPWRNRRDVFRALFKMSCDVGKTWGTTHIVATVNIKSATIYKRLGFDVLADKLWIPSIGEHVLPVCTEFDKVYDWAFGAFAHQHELIKSFSGCFECLLVDVNSKIFSEGEVGQEAYLIGKGMVKISQSDGKAEEVFSLATLDKGSMFGELSLIDDQPRSASAWALTNVELIVLSRDIFWEKIHLDSSYLKGLLKILCERLRDVDQRAFVYAHGTVDARLEFFINKVLEGAVVSAKDPGIRVAKITLEELAYMASATLEQTQNYLLKLQSEKHLSIGERDLTFNGDHTI